MTRLMLGLLLTVLGTSTALAVEGEPENLGVALGVGVVDSIEARQLGFAGGVRVERIDKGGPADRAGLREGDVLVQIGDAPVGSVNQLRRTLAGGLVGEDMDLVVLRGDRVKRLTATPMAAGVTTAAGPTRAELAEKELELALTEALNEGSISWSVPSGSLVAKLDGGRDFSVRVDEVGDEQRLVIQIDGEVVFDTLSSDGDFVIDLDLD